MTTTPITRPSGLSHVRLTVTDITRSKAFYAALLGTDPAADFTDETDDGVRDDPERLYGGCAFPVGDQLVGLRPVAVAGDRFDSTRVGLDHLSLAVDSVDELHRAAERLSTAGIEHGEPIEIPGQGMTVLSLQDPDDINLELTATI